MVAIVGSSTASACGGLVLVAVDDTDAGEPLAPTAPRDAASAPLDAPSGPCDGSGYPDAASCAVSFGATILPPLVARCGTASCHGVPNGAAPRMSREDATGTFERFVAQRAIEGIPYVNRCSTDPSRSSILCNLASPASGAGCGTLMPYGAGGSIAGEQVVKDIETWLRCGAPNN